MIVKQSIVNMIFTIIGIVVAFVNVTYFYPNFMTEEEYGLVTFIFRTTIVIIPILSLGANNILLKYYFRLKEMSQKTMFVSHILRRLAYSVIFFGIVFWVFYEDIQSVLQEENYVSSKLWLIYAYGVLTIVYEYYYFRSRLLMKSEKGYLIKEVFSRVQKSLLICLIVFDWFDITMFFLGDMFFSILNIFLIRDESRKIFKQKVSYKLSLLKFNSSELNKYAVIITLVGLSSLFIVNINVVVLGINAPLNTIAYYGVAISIAVIVKTPLKSLMQISDSIVIRNLMKKQYKLIKLMYKKSSLNMFIASSYITLMIALNGSEFYKMMPESYGTAYVPLIILSYAFLLDAFSGINDSVFFNSNHFKTITFLTLFTVICSVSLAYVLVLAYDVIGLAISVLITNFLYNGLKIFFIKRYFKIDPLSKKLVISVSFFIILSLISLYLRITYFHPIINIALQSLFYSLVFAFVVWKFRFSRDINRVLKLMYCFFLKKNR